MFLGGTDLEWKKIMKAKRLVDNLVVDADNIKELDDRKNKIIDVCAQFSLFMKSPTKLHRKLVEDDPTREVKDKSIDLVNIG